MPPPQRLVLTWINVRSRLSMDILRTYWSPFEHPLRTCLCTFWWPEDLFFMTFWEPEDQLKIVWGSEDLLRNFWGPMRIVLIYLDVHFQGFFGYKLFRAFIAWYSGSWSVFFRCLIVRLCLFQLSVLIVRLHAAQNIFPSLRWLAYC